MDLIRLIKLKKLNNELDNLTEQEKLFISFFDRLYTVKENNVIYFLNKKQYIFEYNLKNNVFWCSYIKVWIIFEQKYNLNNSEIKDLITGVLEKHLNLVGVTTATALATQRCN